MRGRSKIKKPVLVLDSRFADPLVSKFVNKVMHDGKKETAEQLVFAALEKLATEQKLDAPTVLHKVIDKASPILEVKSRRVGGATYQVPVEVSPKRRTILVMRWILDTCRKQTGKPMDQLLYQEMKNILDDTGTVMKKREDLHKMAESNRAFAHFARY